MKVADHPRRRATDREVWSVEEDNAMWHAFSSPGSDTHFCQAWLALLCRQLPGVLSGVVLLESPEANTFVPVAVWPLAAGDLSFLNKVAERALSEKRGVVHRSEDEPKHVHVAYPVEIFGRIFGAVVLNAKARPEAAVQSLLRELHWGVAWLHDLFFRRETKVLEAKGERIGTVMEVLATTLRRGDLQQVLFDAVNHIARQMQCSRVALGLVKGESVQVSALSNAAWFEKNAGIMKLYTSAMEETCDRLAPIAYGGIEESEVPQAIQQNSAHARLASESGAQAILSVPLLNGADCIGVLMLERDSEDAFNEAERAWVDTLSSLLPAVIEQKRLAERGYIGRLREDWKALLERLFGPRHLVWKFGAAALTVTLAVLILVPVSYRVSAKTVIEGEVQRTAVAPFDGFIAASYVRAGDMVKKGQALCLLDDRDLRLEQNKWESEREQYSRKLREAMANHELSNVQILSAQVQQAEAQLALVDDKLSRVKVAAPFDGIVISGDLSQLIGSPAEQGKKLFEIAPLQAYRVILQVDEQEVRHVKVGQTGKLLLSGIVGPAMPFSVSKVTPVATAQDGKNFFKVEAKLDQVPPQLRPGMEGVGKINTESRSLWWVLTHSFTDWLRLTLWNWLP